MQIAKLQIDRFGAWEDLALGPMTSGLNVFWGQDTADRAALTEFIHAVFFGFSDQTRNRFVLGSSRDAGGAVTLNGDSGLQTVYRHDSGDRQGRLIVEAEDGSVLTGRRVESLLDGISQDVFESIFVADFHRRCDVGCLIEAAQAQGLPVVGGHGDASRLEPLRTRLHEQRRRMDNFATSDLSLTALLERRRSLRTDIAALEAAAQQHAERNTQQRRKLQAELVDLEQQQEELHAELRQLDDELQTRQEERQRKECEIQRTLAERQQRVVERRQQLAEIDAQLDRWRHVLRDVELRRERLQAEHESEGPVEDGAADPRHDLRRLEERIEQLHTDVVKLDSDDDAPTCRCERLRSQLSPVLQAMREDIFRLCNQLSVWEASARRTESSGELSQMRRCEAELRQAIQGLSARRQRLIVELSSFQPTGQGLRVSHPDLCRCADHPADSETAWPDVDPVPGLDEELLSVLDAEFARLQQRRRNVLADIEEVDDELSRLRERLEEGAEPNQPGPHRQRLESKRCELERIERQICNGEKRRDLQSGIAELQAEIRALEAATRPSEILQETAELLRQLSRSDLQQISVTPERTVHVHARSGSRTPWSDLGPAERDQVYLSLNLALVAASARAGVRLPLILHDILLRQDGAHCEAIASVLNDFAARGHQILLLLGSGQSAEMFRARGASVRRLPSP
ncbi:MAG: AAA family ATPase, partial [Planctomycetes bacterium]|nr:AAA family ATPase [Planctomycetota bacterium]